MNPSLLADLVLTGALSTALVLGGLATIWILPWSEREQEGTARAMKTLARQAGETVRAEAVLVRAHVAR